MCEATTIAYALMAGATVYSAEQQSNESKKIREEAARNDPAKLAAEKEARALQSANAEMAAIRGRRKQQTLLSSGSPNPTYGEQADPGSLLKVGEVSRGSVRPNGSLMSRGAM